MRLRLLVAPAALAAAFALAAPAASAQTGLQHVVSFENPADIQGVEIGGDLETRFVCPAGCSIVSALPGYPVLDGSHQLLTTDFDIVVQDPVNISWPAMGAYVTGAAAVHVAFYRWDYDPGVWENVETLTLQTDGANTEGSGRAPNAFLGFGFLGDPQDITRAHFYSDAPFTLDDVTIGLPDVPPGIPEPADWALLVVGFALAGAALRHQMGAHGLRRLHNG